MREKEPSSDEALSSPQLREYLRQFEALKQEARVLVNGMSHEAFNWRPHPDRWSVGECLDHLNTLGTLLLPKLKEAMQRGQVKGMMQEGPVEYGWLGRWWISSMQPSSRRRAKTPKLYRPSSSELDKEETLNVFLDLQDELIGLVREADGLDLRRIKAPSPALPMLRLSLGVWFESTAAHEERHLAQARRVTAHAAFPYPEVEPAL